MVVASLASLQKIASDVNGLSAAIGDVNGSQVSDSSYGY